MLLAFIVLTVLGTTPGWLAPVLTFVSSTVGALLIAAVTIRNARVQAASTSRQTTLDEIKFQVNLLEGRAIAADARAKRAEQLSQRQQVDLNKKTRQIELLSSQVTTLKQQLEEALHG